MSKKNIRALHILTGKRWRGAENQVLQLLNTKEANKITNFISVPFNASFFEKFNSTSSKVFKSPNLPILNLIFHIYCIYKYKITTLYVHTNKAQVPSLLLKIIWPNLRLIVLRKVAKPINKHKISKWKYTSPLIDAYVAPSYKIKEVLISGGVEASKITVSYDFILPAKTISINSQNDFVKKHQIEMDCKTIICTLGALDQQKNHQFLIRSLADVKKQGGSFKCYIAGEGPLKQSLHRLIQSLELEEDIKLLGFIDQPEILLKVSNLFIFPSINEGLGSSLLEASAHNCLLIGANSGGIPEVITHNKSGLLFTLKNNTELTSQIYDYICNPCSFKNLIVNSKEQIQRQFNPERSAKLIIDLAK